MAETFVITAGAVSKTIGLPGSSATRLTSIDWGDPQPKRTLVEGRDGSRPVDPSDYENRTIVLGIESQIVAGHTEADSRAWLQGWEQLAGLVNAASDATMVRTSPTGSTTTAELVTMRVTPAAQLDEQWHNGLARATVTLEALPALLGAQQPLSGSLVTTSGLPVWTSSTTVKGDVDALATITPTFAGPVVATLNQVCTAAPTIVKATSLTKRSGSASLTSSGVTDAVSSQVLVDAIAGKDGGSIVLAEYAAPSAGTYEVDARVWHGRGATTLNATPSATWTLLCNGRVVARATTVGARGQTPGPWAFARFGRVAIESGDVLSITYAVSAGSDGRFDGVAIDYLSLARSTASAGVSVVDALNDLEYVGSGDVSTASTASPGASLNGASGLYGGTWSAAGWTIDVDGLGGTDLLFKHVGEAAHQAAVIGSQTLPCAVVADMWHTASDSNNGLSLHQVATGYYVAITLDYSASLIAIATNGSTGSRTERVVSVPMTAGTHYTLYIALDTEHRVTARVSSPSRVLFSYSELISSDIPGSGLWSARVRSPDVGATVFASRVLIGPTIGGETAPSWSAGSSTFVLGDMPRFAAGSTPVVVVRGGGSGNQFDGGHFHNPSSLTVTCTPRYLQVPED